MAIETWGELMGQIRGRDIVRCSGGAVQPQQAYTWAKNGLPRFEHEGYSTIVGGKVVFKTRWKAIQKAAALNGITITGDEILRLSLEHKQKLAEQRGNYE